MEGILGSIPTGIKDESNLLDQFHGEGGSGWVTIRAGRNVGLIYLTHDGSGAVWRGPIGIAGILTLNQTSEDTTRQRN